MSYRQSQKLAQVFASILRTPAKSVPFIFKVEHQGEGQGGHATSPLAPHCPVKIFVKRWPPNTVAYILCFLPPLQNIRIRHRFTSHFFYDPPPPPSSSLPQSAVCYANSTFMTYLFSYHDCSILLLLLYTMVTEPGVVTCRL